MKVKAFDKPRTVTLEDGTVLEVPPGHAVVQGVGFRELTTDEKLGDAVANELILHKNPKHSEYDPGF